MFISLFGHEGAELGLGGLERLPAASGVSARAALLIPLPAAGHVLAPLRVPPDLVVDDVHHEGADLVVSDDGVELAEGGEAEEGVDDVGRQVDRGLPLLSEIGDDF